MQNRVTHMLTTVETNIENLMNCVSKISSGTDSIR